MRCGDPTLAEEVLEHIAEIGAGRCSITDAGIADESDPGAREILAGLLMLHEDLDYARRRQSALLDDLRDAIRARDDFLLVASHELRTPITALALQIDGLLRVLNEKGGGAISENVTRRLALTKRQVDRLTALVARLVDVSRITSGRLELSRERADLVEIVKAVTERFSDDALRSGSTLHLEAGAPISGDFDASRLDQVVTNLVSNAIRYGRGRPITVGVAADDGGARIWVEDQGIGIPSEHHARIFQRFERVAPSTSYAGLGLGLWITRQIVEAMGGTIAVRSAVDAGSVFTVDLPRHT